MIRRALIIIGFIVITFSFVEIGMRIKGFEPYKSINTTIEMEPGWMYESDSMVGLRLHPGTYHIVEGGEYHYTATIDSTGERITSFGDSGLISNKPTLLILGAGSTFGQGLNDNESFPFVLQTELPQYKVRNEAVMGYGLSNNYERLMHATELKKGDAVIYIYHADQNNRYSRTNRKRAQSLISSNKQFSNYHYIDIDSSLNTHLHKFDYHMFPLSSYSAFADYVENSVNTYKDAKDCSNYIARKAILAMNEWCKKRGVEFKLVCWKDDNISLGTLAYLSKLGVHTYNIKVIIAYGDRPAKELAWANQNFADSLSILFKE